MGQWKDRRTCPGVKKGQQFTTHLLMGNRKPYPQVLSLQHQFWHDVLLLKQCLASFFIPAHCQEMTIE